MAVTGLGNLGGLGGIGGTGLPGLSRSEGTDAPSGFKAFFEQALQEANSQMITADRLTEQLVTGQVEDVSQVMLAAQKAELSLQLVIQMRNKLLEAYQEIMRMPV